MEERIKQLTCDIDELSEDASQENIQEAAEETELAQRDSPAGEEAPKFANGEKNFSPSSSVSSTSSSSSAYKKISDIFNRDKKQEKIVECEENPIVIIPQVFTMLYISFTIMLKQYILGMPMSSRSRSRNGHSSSSGAHTNSSYSSQTN